MNRRNCCIVISKMLEKIPKDKVEFIKDLEWNYEDAMYKAPEEVIQWNRTYKTLTKHITIPKEDWEFEVVSVFTTQPVNELKEYFKNFS